MPNPWTYWSIDNDHVPLDNCRKNFSRKFNKPKHLHVLVLLYRWKCNIWFFYVSLMIQGGHFSFSITFAPLLSSKFNRSHSTSPITANVYPQVWWISIVCGLDFCGSGCGTYFVKSTTPNQSRLFSVGTNELLNFELLVIYFRLVHCYDDIFNFVATILEIIHQQIVIFWSICRQQLVHNHASTESAWHS